MEGSMHMRRMEDGYMHRRMQKNKHMQGNDLDTPTLATSRCYSVVSSVMSSRLVRGGRKYTRVETFYNAILLALCVENALFISKLPPLPVKHSKPYLGNRCHYE